MKFILASNSPRRKELLTKAGFVFTVHPADIDETPLSGEMPADFAQRMAAEKALAVSLSYQKENALILAADTIVVSNGEILGKPRNQADAERMLKKLSATTHSVITGYALVELPSKNLLLERETSKVTFRELSQREILEYIQSGEPFDKAGSYGLQGQAVSFVTSVAGLKSNVIGLPIEKIAIILNARLAKSPE